MIYIAIEGGIITSVTKDNDECDEVCVIDYDHSPEGCKGFGGEVEFTYGKKEEAYVYYVPIEKTFIKKVKESR